jgi:hypothetical protein
VTASAFPGREKLAEKLKKALEKMQR